MNVRVAKNYLMKTLILAGSPRIALYLRLPLSPFYIEAFNMILIDHNIIDIFMREMEGREIGMEGKKIERSRVRECKMINNIAKKRKWLWGNRNY